MKSPDGKEVFCKVRLRITLFTFDLVITENFSNSDAQVLLVGAFAVSASGSLRPCSLYVLKTFRLKYFKYPIKESNFLSEKCVC